ncbi:hypothetical protein HDU85_005293 [Gaertneriomyces sp. JEL0708]|nr:hypothetical protein HDU85_005293 [Gaertneriomyces sp. JEL0708]
MPHLELPHELWTRIFSHLDPRSSAPLKFALLNSTFNAIAHDPHARAQLFVHAYGTRLALYTAFQLNRAVLTGEVARRMRCMGAPVQRFLVQVVDKEYHRTSERVKNPVDLSLYVFLIQEGFKLYGADADFKDDDVAKFERLVYGGVTVPTSPGSPTPDTLDAIRTLIKKFAFVPVRGLGSPIDETIFLLSKLDINLIPKLVDNGLDLDSVNDQVVERVLWRTDLDEKLLARYLNHGFVLSEHAIKKGLQIGRPSIVHMLRAHVDEEDLEVLAHEALVDMFGPSTSRSWAFVPDTAEFIINTFHIPLSTLARAIYTNPDASRLPNGSCVEFPATRCYMKPNPCPLWRWILRTYGPHHEFTRACFDDALSRAASDRDLHRLHDEYIHAGVRFYPRHVKILACRLLHRDMTANALQHLRTLADQIRDDRDAGVMTEHERIEWLTTLRDEIVENEEWMQRMQTTQLEGGARGGAYRISRAPEEALKFLHVARELASELGVPGGTVCGVDQWVGVVRRTSSRRVRKDGVRGWVKRVGVWWKDACEKGVWGVVEGVA